MNGLGLAGNLISLVIIALLIILFYPQLITAIKVASSIISNNLGPNFNFPNSTQNTQSNKNVKFGPIINYTLYLINKDRSNYGLSNVTLSPILSGQQHAESMLQNNYFSHWDIYGMKPYMRYTLVGGQESVQENIAYTKEGLKACIGSFCTTYGNINVTRSLKQMEYNMVYNDSQCCNNGHRYNILDPKHNQVSIGVAYNGSSVYLVEDFVNNYINWLNNTPKINSNMEALLEGSIINGYKLSSIEISYDEQISNMSRSALDRTSEYSYGPTIAGVVGDPLNYYPSITTIVADTYYKKGSNFFVSFNMDKLIKGNGPGEYTIVTWLNGTTPNSSFVGSTYTIFVNSSGGIYTPSNV